MFYKWGAAIGGKLEEIVQREISAMNGNGSELKKLEPIEKNVLHEGELLLCLLFYRHLFEKLFARICS